MEAILKPLSKRLDEVGFDCTLVQEDPEYLRVTMGSTPDGTACVLHMTPLSTSELPQSPIRIQMHLEIPIELKDESLEDLASLLNFINNSLELPGFFLDELNKRLFFRYMHFAPAGRVDLDLLESLVGMIQLLPGLFLSPIHQVATGDRTFDDLLDEIMADAEKLQKPENE